MLSKTAQLAFESIEDPATPGAPELQALVDVAKMLLAIDAAKGQGLVAGALKVNVEKCRELLAEASGLGIEPRMDAAGPASLVDLLRQANDRYSEAEIDGRNGDGSLRIAVIVRRAVPGRIKLFTAKNPGVRYSIDDGRGAEIGSVICDGEGIVIHAGKYRWQLLPREFFEAAVHAVTK